MGQIRKWQVASGEWRVLALLACLLIPTGAHAAPRPEAMVLRGTGRDGSLLALRVPLNVFAQLQAAGSGSNVNLNQIGGGSVSSSLYDSGNTAIKVNCVVGCSATSGFSDSGTFTAGTTAVNNISGVFNDGLAALASGTAGAARITNDRMLFVNIGKIGGAVPSLTGSSLNVNCTGGCGTSSFSDSSAFTAGSTAIQNVGGVFNDGLSAVSSGSAAAPRITSSRAFHVNLRNNSGTEVGTSGSPIRVDPTGTTAQPVTGTFWQATQPVSGTFWQATQPVSGTVTANAGTGTMAVSGPLTDTQLRATAVPVSGTVTATGPLTDTQLRATPVPISGTTTANQGTAQTAANGWPIRASDGTNLVNVGDNANSALRVNVVAGGAAGGTSSNFNATFPASGTAAGASDGTNMKPLTVDASGYLKVNVAAGGAGGGAVTVADGADVTLGAKADAKNTATDATAITVMQVLKEISYMEQNPASRAVTGPLTDTQLRATALPISGSVNATLAAETTKVIGTVNQGTSPWVVSGTVTASGPLTDTQLRATAVPVSGTITIGTFPDNEPFNVAQINGVTPLMGNGATGTGSQRVTLASDNSALPAWGLGATGSAVPSGAQYVGGNSSGNLTGFERCDSSAFLNMSTATTTEIVALTASQSIRVCSYRVMAGGTTNVKFVRGTGSNCGTGQADVSATWPLTTQTGLAPSGGISPIYVVTSANALCVTSSAAVTLAVEVSYTKY